MLLLLLLYISTDQYSDSILSTVPWNELLHSADFIYPQTSCLQTSKLKRQIVSHIYLKLFLFYKYRRKKMIYKSQIL